ncbi:AMP-binding protein [Burkholderia stagnalis]
MRECLAAARWIRHALRISGLPAWGSWWPRLAWLGIRHGWSLYILAALWRNLAPDETALVDDRRRWSWRELAREVDALAAALDAMGVVRRDRVGMMCRNHGGFVTALLACMKLGVDVVLVNTRFDATQLTMSLDTQRVTTLIVDPEYEAFVRDADFRGRVLWSDARQAPEATDAGMNLPGLIASTSPGRLRRRPPGALIVLTSGTTRHAKGVRRALSLRQVAGAVHGLVSRLSLRVGTPTLITVPLFHGYGIASLALGLALRCPVTLTRHTEGSRLWEVAKRSHAKSIVVVPTLLRRILDASVADPQPSGAIERIVSGSAPLSARLVKDTFERWGPVLYNLYGATEAGLIAIADPRDLIEAPESVGRPVDGTAVSIRGESGRVLDAGAMGEVFVTGRLVFDGYTDAHAPRTPAGTFATGDGGWLDEIGRLHLCGRMDDMLIVGGENIHPLQVEDRLMTLPQVIDAAVAGHDADDGGQRIAAWLVLRPGQCVTGPDFATVLPAYMRPTRWTIVETLPRNAIGKLERRRLSAGDAANGWSHVEGGGPPSSASMRQPD